MAGCGIKIINQKHFCNYKIQFSYIPFDKPHSKKDLWLKKKFSFPLQKSSNHFVTEHSYQNTEWIHVSKIEHKTYTVMDLHKTYKFISIDLGYKNLFQITWILIFDQFFYSELNNLLKNDSYIQ